MAGTFILTGDNLRYLLSLLNSKISLFYFDKIATSSGVGTNMWKKYKIELLPIANIEDTSKINKLADLIIKGKEKKENTTQLEKQIDLLIYDIYGLNAQEVEFIENL